MSHGSSIMINRRGKKRRRVQDEGDVSMRGREKNKFFHDLRSYFDSKFSQAQRKTRDWLRKSEPIRTNLNIGTTNSN